MRRFTTLIFALFLCFQCWTQPLDIRPQFGHDPIWGDITEDGRYAITAGRNSVVLWNLKKEQIIIEQPINCMSAQFVTGFPFNYVALNLIHNNGSLDSSEEKRTIVDILTGKEIFKMSSNSIKKGHNSSFQISFPFDSLGRFDVLDNVGNTHRLFGGKINGGMGNVEISSDNELLLVGGKHPVLWDLNEMRIHSSIPLYEHFMKNKEIVDPGLNIQPVLRTTIKETRKGTIKTGWRQFFKAHFVKDGDIISGTPDGRICVFSKEGQFLREYKTKPLSQNILDCALFDNTILGATANNWAAIGQLNRDSLLVCSANEKEGVQLYRIVYEVLPIPDRDIFICTSDGGIYIGNLRHPENGMEVVPTPREVLSAEIIDKDSVLLTGVTGYYYILNLNTLAVDTYKSGIDNDFHAAIVLSDGTILLGGHYGKVVVIDGKEMTPINIMSFGNGTIHGFAEDINRSRIYLSSSDGALRVIDSRSFDLIVTCYNLGDNESIIVAPDGYFSADKGVADLMMYGRGAELFSFDHFDLLRNRPDIIKERLGGRPEEVALLKRVYEKRLRRMGFSNSMLHESTHLPDVAITRFPNVEKVSVDKISMRVQFKDRVYPIKKVLAWINGTPIFGRDGLSVEGKVIEKDIDLALATGENIIEVSCINSAGVESLRESRTITFTNPNARKNLYIVAMGVSRYRQPGQELNYAAKDAGDIVSLFAECGQGLYDGIYSLCLTDEEVDMGVTRQLREFVSQAGRDDAIIAFYAGHGLVNKDYDYFLSTYSTDFSHPEEASIRYEDFESVFDGIHALNKLILVDACHSGEIDKEDVRTVISEAMTKGKVFFRGTTLGHESIESLVLKSQFNDIRRGLGATIFAGSSGLEVAVESDEWQNGLFTWSIRNGLQKMTADLNNDGLITVSEIMHFSELEVYKLSGGEQTPGARSINPSCDFVIRKRE